MSEPQDRWDNKFPVAWQGQIPGDPRTFRAIRVDEKTAIAQVLVENRWLNLGSEATDPVVYLPELESLVFEQVVADIGSSLIKAVAKRKFAVHFYDRSNEFIAQCAALGLYQDTVVELTPEQVLNASQKIAVMLRPAKGDEPQLLCVDTPRWSFKQR